MITDKFKIGDIVRLKGWQAPWMTVIDITHQGVDCGWFVEQILKKSVLQPNALELVFPEADGG